MKNKLKVLKALAPKRIVTFYGDGYIAIHKVKTDKIENDLIKNFWNDRSFKKWFNAKS